MGRSTEERYNCDCGNRNNLRPGFEGSGITYMIVFGIEGPRL